MENSLDQFQLGVILRFGQAPEFLTRVGLDQGRGRNDDDGIRTRIPEYGSPNQRGRRKRMPRSALRF